MIKIKLFRTGSKGNPSYRIVAVDSTKRLGGSYIENLGFYDPKTKPATIKLDKQKIDAWLGKGAQLTATVKKLLA